MKNTTSRIAVATACSVVALLLATGATAGTSTTLATPAELVPGELLVRFRDSVTPAARRTALDSHDAVEKEKLSQRGLVLVRLKPGQGVAEAVAAFSARPDVVYAEPNWIYRSAVVPNDPRFASGELWGLHNVGQSGGVADADIDAPEAWETTTGSGGLVVAVTDTGVAYDHPDLGPNMWTNPGEVVDGIDNDGNGRVDDVRGWDTVDHDNDPQDTEGHGTHVAGTIGARGDNGVGVAGVDWSSTLMPVRVLGPGGGTNATVTEGFAYATQMGATIVNASLGGPGFSQAMKNVIDGSPNTLFVVAAGNEARNNEATAKYPCNYTSPNLVCVAATTRTDALAGFSNFGTTSVDLGAPGTAIVSTWLGPDGIYDDAYATLQGTSMATPHVAGVAALAWAKNPAASVGDVKSAILSGGDPKPSLAGKTVTGRRLNANGSLALIPPGGSVGLAVTKAGTGGGTVSGSGIDCGADCQDFYPVGTTVILTASPGPGSVFASWSGCDSPDGTTCTMSMTSSKTVTASFAVKPTFADVPPSNPFYLDIEQLYDLGITEGCGTNGSGQLLFCPGAFVPREQMAAFLVRAKGLSQLVPATPTFADVTPSNPFFGYVERLFEQGIMRGCGSGGAQLLFCPSQLLPREQLAAVLVRAKGISQSFPATPTFGDVSPSNPFFGYVERLYEQGVTQGCGSSGGQLLFCPGAFVSREQMAAFLIRAFA